ncbi:MAG: ketoacyl-ACP synthase III [Puniceicoccaceae bacterium]|nr:ketoacyl-ACP synthase III [Puniceicoccaceae bacterium]
MSKCTFNKVEIRGIVTCIPTIEKCIDDEVDLFGGNYKQIARLKRTIGLNKRRVVDSQTTAADLCYYAAEHLLKRLEVDFAAVDSLVFVTQNADYPQPCNAAVIHGRLGLSTDCSAFDINLGCSGYVYGLWLAHMMVATGGSKNVLLLAGDTISRIVHPRDRSLAPLFGDGGSATLISSSTAAIASWFCLNTDGKGYKNLIVPAGGFRQPSTTHSKVETSDVDGNIRSLENLFMDGAEIFNFTIKVVPQAIRELIVYAKLDLGALDYFVLHQANRYIISNIAKRLNIDLSKVPMRTVEQYGNQSSASIPCAICGELSEALASDNSPQILLSGFGVGLSWASAIIGTSAINVCEIIEYPSSE